MIRCDCHEIELQPGETAWVKDDGEILCEDGHRDETHEDVFDQHDHGAPYDVSMLLTLTRK